MLKTPWPIADESVQTVVTSPPYWGLRDYGTATWEGGSAECDHIAPPDRGMTHSTTSTLGPNRDGLGPENAAWKKVERQYQHTCANCGARRIDAQLGLERTPEEYVANMVAVFREVRRVLRKDGTVWLNLGDCYANQGFRGNLENTGGFTGERIRNGKKGGMDSRPREIPAGLKPKDLVGIPWRVAFALQADGWWLRSDIVWAKPNPMPESIRDRPTRAHEFVFLLTKSERYFYDQDAIREPHRSPSAWKTPAGWDTSSGNGGHGSYHRDGREKGRTDYRHKTAEDPHAGGRRQAPEPGEPNAFHPLGANARTVWQIATEPFPDAHFATFPTELARRCILAGTSEAGACGKCGTPLGRVVNHQPGVSTDCPKTEAAAIARGGRGRTSTVGQSGGGRTEPVRFTKGWAPGCGCDSTVSPCLVLDPFAGSGTTLLVADTLGRNAVGLELNPAYIGIAEKRIRAPRTEAEAARVALEDAGQMGIFS